MNRQVLQWSKSKLFSIYERLESFVFPPLCIICDKSRACDDKWLCPSCKEHLQLNNSSRQACPRCSQNNNFRTCTCEILWEYPFESIYSILDYDELVQVLMHNIKYFDKRKLAYDLGAMFSFSIPDPVFEGIDGITSVPLHWYRKHKRGYNQAEWLAKGFLSKRKDLKYYEGIIIRKHYTKTQTKLAREQRKKNISRAFIVPESRMDLIKGKSLIVVDDVITTGSTTAACAEVLLKAGAKSVRVLSLARD